MTITDVMLNAPMCSFHLRASGCSSLSQALLPACPSGPLSALLVATVSVSKAPPQKKTSLEVLGIPDPLGPF